MLCVLSAAATAGAQPVDLSRYRLTATVNLPASAIEASALAYSWETGNLYILGDPGTSILEVTRAGAVVSIMALTGFEDPEGLTFIGGGQFVIAEERQQDAYRLTYIPGGSVNRATLPGVSLGPFVGNIGIEGIAFESLTGGYFAVKESSPQQVLSAMINFGSGVANVNQLFTPALGVTDLADLAVLSNVPSLVGSGDQDNLLLLSQESARLLKVSRSGAVLGSLSVAALSAVAEGVTIDENRVIYLCDETPRLFILTPLCYANCDGSTVAPTLNVNDFSCFLNAFAAGDTAANCDGSTAPPALNVNDFACFLNRFSAGCP